MVERYAAGSGDEDGESGKAFVSLNWLLSEEHMDLETELAWGFLDYLLLGTSAAPLRKALNDSGLGEALIGVQGSSSCCSTGNQDETLQGVAVSYAAIYAKLKFPEDHGCSFCQPALHMVHVIALPKSEGHGCWEGIREVEYTLVEVCCVCAGARKVCQYHIGASLGRQPVSWHVRCPGGGLGDELRQPVFSLGMKGVKPENASKV